MDRAFSVLAVKSIDSDARVFAGVASSPEPDRHLDVVEPLGLRYKNPVCLLWMHEHDKPVGTVRFDKPTRAGITFKAQIPKVDEAGTFKDQADHAWMAVKHGAVRSVSIGFLPIEAEPLPTGGIRFKKAELIELSLVSIPAHPGATITEIRALDAAIRSGSTAPASVAQGSVAEALKSALRAGSQRKRSTPEAMGWLIGTVAKQVDSDMAEIRRRLAELEYSDGRPARDS